jgi:phosphoserine phosphatase RsbU/P
MDAEDLDDLYENAPCGYLSLSPDARIVKINRTLTQWLGAADCALVGQPFHALLSFGGRIAYETHMAPMLRLNGSVNELALDLLQADGGKLPVIANAAEKRGPGAEHLFTRVTLFKAVDRRTYERSLVAARTQAEAAAAAEQDMAVLREQFISVFGHDLKNPLAAVSAGIRMIEDKEVLSERGQRILREMSASAARAVDLVESVLDLARGRLGGGLAITPVPEPNLTPVLEQIVSEMRSVAPDRELRTDFSIDQAVTCDSARIGQLASNLIANAVTHGAPNEPIEVSAHTTADTFELSVANGGEPIPESARAKLFLPFFRAAVRPSRQGLGLGLYIVSEIAKAHGGTMEVTSSELGTRFTFTMPLVQPDE